MSSFFNIVCCFSKLSLARAIPHTHPHTINPYLQLLLVACKHRKRVRRYSRYLRPHRPLCRRYIGAHHNLVLGPQKFSAPPLLPILALVCLESGAATDGMPCDVAVPANRSHERGADNGAAINHFAHAVSLIHVLRLPRIKTDPAEDAGGIDLLCPASNRRRGIASVVGGLGRFGRVHWLCKCLYSSRQKNQSIFITGREPVVLNLENRSVDDLIACKIE